MIDQGLWKLTGFILVVVLLVIFPTLHMLEKQDDIIRIRLIDEVDYYLSQVRLKGCLTTFDYEQFQSKLQSLGNQFTVKIDYEKKLFVPVYENPQDVSTFTGEMQVVFDLIPHDTLVKAMYASSEKKYKMSKGDYLTITVTSQLKSKAQVLKETLWRINSEAPSHYVRLGGMITHEND